MKNEKYNKILFVFHNWTKLVLFEGISMLMPILFPQKHKIIL